MAMALTRLTQRQVPRPPNHARASKRIDSLKSIGKDPVGTAHDLADGIGARVQPADHVRRAAGECSATEHVGINVVLCAGCLARPRGGGRRILQGDDRRALANGNERVVVPGQSVDVVAGSADRKRVWCRPRGGCARIAYDHAALSADDEQVVRGVPCDRVRLVRAHGRSAQRPCDGGAGDLAGDRDGVGAAVFSNRNEYLVGRIPCDRVQRDRRTGQAGNGVRDRPCGSAIEGHIGDSAAEAAAISDRNEYVVGAVEGDAGQMRRLHGIGKELGPRTAIAAREDRSVRVAGDRDELVAR